MRKSIILGAVAAAILGGLAAPVTAGATQSGTIQSGGAHSGFHARYTAIPYQGVKARVGAATAGLPLFSHSVVSGGRTFTYRQVGKDPFVKQSVPTSTVAVKVIPLRIKFSNRTFDPTSTACSPGGSPAALLAKSPLVKTRAYTVGGTAVGTDQYTGFARRAEYFNQVRTGGLNPGYHFNLGFAQTGKWTVTVSGGQIFGSGCSSVGALDINSFDAFVKSTI